MLPELSPLIFHDAICSTCGEKMTKKVEKDKQNRALRITYTCTNPATGCKYFVESDQRLSGMQHPVK